MVYVNAILEIRRAQLVHFIFESPAVYIALIVTEMPIPVKIQNARRKNTFALCYTEKIVSSVSIKLKLIYFIQQLLF